MVPWWREVGEQVQHLADECRVERAGHFVEQQQRRTHGQRAHDGDALLLTAREAFGVVVGAILAARCDRATPALRRATSSRLRLRARTGPSRMLSSTLEVGKEVVGLKDHADVTSHEVGVDAWIGQTLTEEADARRRRSSRAGWRSAAAWTCPNPTRR